MLQAGFVHELLYFRLAAQACVDGTCNTVPVVNVALTVMTMLTLFASVITLKTCLCSVKASNNLHCTTSLTFTITMILMQEEKKINHIWFFITRKVFYAGRSRQWMTALRDLGELSVVEEEH